MGNWKKEYEEIKVPENMKERMEYSCAGVQDGHTEEFCG